MTYFASSLHRSSTGAQKNVDAFQPICPSLSPRHGALSDDGAKEARVHKTIWLLLHVPLNIQGRTVFFLVSSSKDTAEASYYTKRFQDVSRLLGELKAFEDQDRFGPGWAWKEQIAWSCEIVCPNVSSLLLPNRAFMTCLD